MSGQLRETDNKTIRILPGAGEVNDLLEERQHIHTLWERETISETRWRASGGRDAGLLKQNMTMNTIGDGWSVRQSN